MIRVKQPHEIEAVLPKGSDKPLFWYASNAFSSFFQGYTRAMNKMYNRTGPLFESRFKRIPVLGESYFTQLVLYVHCNPVKHKLVKNLGDYVHCSYLDYFDKCTAQTRAQTEVLDWFGGLENFRMVHKLYASTLHAPLGGASEELASVTGLLK